MRTIKSFLMFGVITITLPFGSVFTVSSGSGQGQAVSQQQQNLPPAAVNSIVGANTSFNWAGYVAPQGTFTSVSGTWIVPSVAAATSTMADVTWVGIGGATGHDLIQAGTQAVASPSGGVSYQAWYETLPQATQPVTLTVAPGNSISAAITQTSQNNWLISLRNNTTGQSFQTSLTYTSSLSSAEWIEEMPSDGNAFLPLDNFGATSFTGGLAVENGNTVTIGQSGAQPITMVNSAGQVLASVSALGSDGESFTVTRSNVPANPASRVTVVPNGKWHRVGVGLEGYDPRPRTTTTTPTTPTTVTLSDASGYQQLLALLQQLQALRLQFHNQLTSQFMHNTFQFGSRK